MISEKTDGLNSLVCAFLQCEKVVGLSFKIKSVALLITEIVSSKKIMLSILFKVILSFLPVILAV